MQTNKAARLPRRGIYWLPNLFTSAALFAGFYAIVAAMQDKIILAALAIFVALIMDGLDGRVARMTNTQSAFGAEYDSLSDVVSFGVAPALVVYSWSLQYLGKVGWLIAFIFAAAGALRLARFNTQVASVNKRYFQGLPIPAAAAVLASIVWLAKDYGFEGQDLAWGLAVITALSAALMVSNIRYHSFKQLNIKYRVRFIVISFCTLGLVLISVDPPKMLSLIFLGYAVSGPVYTLWRLQKTRRLRERLHQSHHDKA